MPTEEPAATAAAVKSPLDKPLHLLTDDDIAQLTREDCRRFLKEKGMRKPSWNKSQAIQQVISLKKLLETTPDSETAHHSNDNNNNNNSNNNNNNSHRVSKNVNASVGISETVPLKEKVPENCSDLPGRVAAVENVSAPPRTIDSPDVPVGQMTIFYGGKVNVYDDMPADKAREIMHLAASPLHFSQDAPFDGTMAVQSSPCQLQVTGVRGGPESAAVLLPAPQPVRTSESSRLYGEANSSFHEDNAVEGPGSRKASVQRYLEKRKDRFKSRRKVGTTSSPSLDIYLNHQMGSQALSEHASKGNTCSPPQVRPPTTPTRCNSVENNVARSSKISAALDEKDMKE